MRRGSDELRRWLCGTAQALGAVAWCGAACVMVACDAVEGSGGWRVALARPLAVFSGQVSLASRCRRCSALRYRDEVTDAQVRCARRDRERGGGHSTSAVGAAAAALVRVRAGAGPHSP